MNHFFAIAIALAACQAPASSPATTETSMQTNQPADTTQTIHGFKVAGLTGGTIDFATFKGKKILIVNTASECGYTPQYKDLQALYDRYKDKLVIVGFPANNFGGQEPGSNEEIHSFCEKNYGISFPMAAKISVKGSDMAPIYQWLTQQKLNGVLDAEVSWNFNKFLLDENGHLLQHFKSSVTPLSEEITRRL